MSKGISIASDCMYIATDVLDLMGRPERVNIGYNSGVLVICPDENGVLLRTDHKTRYPETAGRKLKIGEIFNKIGFPKKLLTSKAYPFEAYWDENTQMLYVEIIVNKAIREKQDLLTIKELNQLAISRADWPKTFRVYSGVYYLCRSGQIPSVFIEHRYMVKLEDVETFIAKNYKLGKKKKYPYP